MEDIYSAYAVLNAKIKELENKKDELKTKILSSMIENNLEKMQHTLGSFTVAKLKKWTYPEYVTEMEEAFKATKAKSQSVGDATFVEEESLRFTGINI